MSRWITVPDFDSGLLSARPTAEFEGRLYYGTDTNVIYYDNGSTWGAAIEVNDLATAGIAGIADNQLAVGTGADTAEYQSLTTGAVKFDTGTGAFTQAASSDLSDMATKTGTGTEVVMSGSPTIVTPTIASMANATHDHEDAAGGGQLGTTALVDDAITYAKIQNVVADDVFLGNNSGAGTVVDELTATEATAMLDTFSTSSTTQGVVAGSNSVGATYYLNGNGTWSIPPGGSAATLTRPITVEDPTASENVAMFYTTVAITVTQITAVIIGSTSVTFNVSHGTSRAAVTNDVMSADDVADSTTTGNITTSFGGGDPTIPASSFVALTTSALSGTPDELHVTVEYTED